MEKTYKEEARCRVQELRKNATWAEKKFIALLRKHKIPYRFQKLVYTPTTFYILDFLTLTNPPFILEIDGTSHIGKRVSDWERTMDILNLDEYKKHRLIRIKNEDVYNGKAEKTLKILLPKYFIKK